MSDPTDTIPPRPPDPVDVVLQLREEYRYAEIAYRAARDHLRRIVRDTYRLRAGAGSHTSVVHRTAEMIATEVREVHPAAYADLQSARLRMRAAQSIYWSAVHDLPPAMRLEARSRAMGGAR